MANTSDLEGVRLWKEVRQLHGAGFMTLVTRQRSFVPSWAYMLSRVVRGQRAALTDGDYGYRISFADVHRMQMRYLQARLIDLTVPLQFNSDGDITSDHMQDLESVMRRYVQAVQDQEYMAKYWGKASDPFIASSERAHDEHLLADALLRAEKTTADFREVFRDSAIPTGPWETGGGGGVQPLGTTRSAVLRRARCLRVAGALVGGAFFIGPMWLLALKRELYLQLGVATGCVSAAFGLLMA
ncbi:hypothetical protein BDW74DRAFT_180651 [Aspergillus multicolor]|uniref:uncharacterized protein n=1 Tax=Aspergillus multicolor TaxID=41759 RepID=UPI003CCDBE1A